ncbi:hypothetical protein [Actinoplanes sp. NPDC026619]|uniref:hypothetical protein n=1 Tax=Actinoplanes sp. NPDC026619 TaxID=3155798 RepID=UPI00340421AE
MAKLSCVCGTLLRDDDPDNALRMLSNDEFDVDRDATYLFGRSKLVLHCPVCGRLWVFWEPYGDASEYVFVPDES